MKCHALIYLAAHYVLAAAGCSTSGECKSRECLEAVIGKELAESQFPAQVTEVRYYHRGRTNYHQFEFKLGADEFLDWVEGLGWDRDDVLASRGFANVVVVRIDGEGIVSTPDGYSLRSTDSGHRQRREVYFDCQTGTCYFMLWPPLPEHLVNKRLLDSLNGSSDLRGRTHAPRISHTLARAGPPVPLRLTAAASLPAVAIEDRARRAADR